MNIISRYFYRFIYRAQVISQFEEFKKNPKSKQLIVDRFHKLFYDSHILQKTWNESTFLGTPIQKCPFDLFIYQEILFDIKPDIIIETGTAFGGSAHYMATICDQLNKGEIYTIDIQKFGKPPKHKRIHYLYGSSVDDDLVDQIERKIKPRTKVVVILDSDHTAKHVAKELEIYTKFVTKGSYLIVEDTNVNGNPVFPGHGPGPHEALQDFLETNTDYEADLDREKFMVSFNPGGYLKKVK